LTTALAKNVTINVTIMATQQVNWNWCMWR